MFHSEKHAILQLSAELADLLSVETLVGGGSVGICSHGDFGVLRPLEIRAHWPWPALTSSSCSYIGYPVSPNSFIRADFWWKGMRRSTFHSEKKGFSVKRGEAIQ